MEDECILDLTALKTEEVYACPIGAFWWDTPSPESPLGFLWLARILYPDLMSDIDLKQEDLEFFETF